MRDRFECPECSRNFGSEGLLREHEEMEHGSFTGMEEGFELEFPDFGKHLNRSFALGLLVGLLVASAGFSGYLYWDSLDHRPEVPITVVTCDNCSYDRFQTATDRVFNTRYSEVDYRSQEGQELIGKYNIKYVPAFIFNKKVEDLEGFKRVKHVLVEFEDAYVIPDRGNRVAQRLSSGKELEGQ